MVATDLAPVKAEYGDDSGDEHDDDSGDKYVIPHDAVQVNQFRQINRLAYTA